MRNAPANIVTAIKNIIEERVKSDDIFPHSPMQSHGTSVPTATACRGPHVRDLNRGTVLGCGG